MAEDLSWIEQALLIYGPRKGGTTLYQNLLDGGAEVFVYPAELKLKYLARTPVLTATDYHALVKLPTNKPKEMNDIGKGDRWNPQAYFVHTREHTVSSSQFDRAGYDADWSNDESGESPVGDLVRKDIVRVYRNCPVRLQATAHVVCKGSGWTAIVCLEPLATDISRRPTVVAGKRSLDGRQGSPERPADGWRKALDLEYHEADVRADGCQCEYRRAPEFGPNIRALL